MGGRTHGKTTEIVLREVKAIHGDTLYYDKFEYVNCNTKVTVGCTIHKDYYFEKWPNDLKAGTGCPKCSGNYKKTHSEFIAEIKNLYPQLTVVGKYKNAKTKIPVLCNEHNYNFSTTANQLISGHLNCPDCVIDKSIQTKLVKSKSIADPASKTEYELYRRLVWRYSNRAYKEHLFRQKRDRHNHLDHVLSILDGYNNLIPAKVVGSVHNLRIISAVANRKKSYKSDITVKELMEKYNA